jgi:hypothetical protein
VEAVLAKVQRTDLSMLTRPELDALGAQVERKIYGVSLTAERLRPGQCKAYGTSSAFGALPLEKKEALGQAHLDLLEAGGVAPKLGKQLSGIRSYLERGDEVTVGGVERPLVQVLFDAWREGPRKRRLDTDDLGALSRRLKRGGFERYTFAVETTTRKPLFDALLDLEGRKLYVVDYRVGTQSPDIHHLTDREQEQRLVELWLRRVARYFPRKLKDFQ